MDIYQDRQASTSTLNWKGLLLHGICGGLIWFTLASMRGIALNLPKAFSGIGLWYTPGLDVITLAFISCLFSGYLAVWMYVSMCPFYGPGPATAVRVGLALGSIVGLTHGLWTISLEMPLWFTIWIVVTEVIIGLVVTMLATSAYKEAEEDTSDAVSAITGTTDRQETLNARPSIGSNEAVSRPHPVLRQ
jgi:hypothetical protein